MSDTNPEGGSSVFVGEVATLVGVGVAGRGARVRWTTEWSGATRDNIGRSWTVSRAAPKTLTMTNRTMTISHHPSEISE